MCGKNCPRANGKNNEKGTFFSEVSKKSPKRVITRIHPSVEGVEKH